MAPVICRARKTTFIVICTFLVYAVSNIEAEENRHIVAFFQGPCKPDSCQHTCRDIDKGYICECHDGYKLNKDGFSCSPLKKSLQGQSHARFTSETSTTRETILAPAPSTQQSSDSNILLGSEKLKSQSLPSEHNQAQDESQSLSSGQALGSKTLKLTNKESVRLTDNVHIHTVDLSKDFAKPESDSYINDLWGTKSRASGSDHPKILSTTKSPDFLKSKLCQEIVCQNNGTCVVDNNHPRCDCQLGFTGEFCKQALEVRYPQFTGTGYIALPVLKTGYKDVDIHVEFRPAAQNGLLLFSAEFENGKADFFSIAIVNGYAEFRFDCGTGLGIVQTEHTVNTGHWNRLRVRRVDNQASITLNDHPLVQGSSKGAYSRITLRLNVFLGGYTNMEAIRNRVGLQKQFVGCIQEVVINEYKYDLRKGTLVGDAQFGMNVGECSAGVCDGVVCQNGGTCSAVAADKYICLCPLGTGGRFCEERVQAHIPEFSGHSYLQYNGLGRSVLSFLEMELVLKPSHPEGLILYNGYEHSRTGDFLSLAMREGHLELRFDLGTGPAIIRSLEPVSLNQWHWVRVTRTGLQGVLEVDDQMTMEGKSQGAFTQLTLLLDLFVGGHQNFDETSKFANVTESFRGCIQKVVINKHPLYLMRSAVSGVNIAGCEHPCVGEPCLNGGECVPDKDVYRCYCPLGYTNTNCEDKLQENINIPKFSGHSFLMYTSRKVTKRVSGDKIDVQMALRPYGLNGLLFWSGLDHDYLALGFVEGALQFRYNLGSGEAVISYNDSRLFDGQWHFIRAQRDKQDGYLEIDSTEIIEGSSPGSYSVLNTDQVLYIGGMSDIAQNTNRKFTSGYVGCIRELTLAEDYRVKLVNSAQSGRNIHQCIPDV